MKIALCLIIKPTDQEAELLSRCLSYAALAVDDIFITQAGEQPNSKVSEVIKAYQGHESFWKWNNSFADARNFNFSQVPKEYDYILWLDADDVLRGAAKIRPTVEANLTVDTFSFWYLYAFDEFNNPIVVHHKTRIVKNDSCVTWVGALHEDFKENRQLTTKHVEGIEVLHLSNEGRFLENRHRNLVIAEAQAATLPNDPRSYWNLASSQGSLGNYKEAIEAYERFFELSQSDDEKYIARLRRAEAFWQMGDKFKALDEARYAVGLKPNFPDAYHLLGDFYMRIDKFDEAAKFYLTGLTKKVPYYSIIVYNPRDYDFRPMSNLARCYVALNRPDLALPLLKACAKIQPEDKALQKAVRVMAKEQSKFNKVLAHLKKLTKITDKEKLRAELDALPDEVKSHPAVCAVRNQNFIKTETTGNEVSIFCGFTEGEWTPETARTKGVGGSEEAVIHLARLLAKKGWAVTVFNNCGHKEYREDNVSYKPFWTWNYRDKQDILILWRSPKMLDYDINASRVFIDLHDVISPGEFTEKRLAKIEKIFVKSKFHRTLFPDIPDEKFAVIPNGIDSAVFEGEHQKDPFLMVNTSSPDRSLSTLVELFPKVKEQVPEAKLKWAYGWKTFDIVHSDNPRAMKWKADIQAKMKELGIEELGMVSHGKVAELYKEAQVLAYPSEFAEIDCISITKAVAAGCVPVTTDFAAQGEKTGLKVHSEKTKDTWCGDYQFDFALSGNHDEWVKLCVQALQEPTLLPRQEYLTNYDWNNIVEKWHQVLTTSIEIPTLGDTKPTPTTNTENA